jgi:hypothetical protein
MQLKEQGKLFVVSHRFALWFKEQIKSLARNFFIIKERRPNNPNNEHDAKRAEKWRMHVIKEIAKKVTQIQNGT